MEKANPTNDILEFILVPFCPIDFIGVSKRWREFAKPRAHTDLRLTKKLVQQAIVSACSFGDLALAKAFLAHSYASPIADDQEAICTAIYNRKNEVAKYILENFAAAVDPRRKWLPKKKTRTVYRGIRFESPIETAVGCGNREMIDYFLANPQNAPSIFVAAIEYDENLAWEIINAKEKYNLQMEGNFLVVALSKNSETLFKAIMKFPEISFNAAWSYIRSYRYNHSDSWPFTSLVEDPRFELTDEVISYAIGKCKTLEELEAIIARKGNFLPTAELLDRALELGKMDVVKFLFSKGANSTQRGFSHAAHTNNPEMVDLLLEHGIKNENNCVEALTSLAYAGKHPQMIAKLMLLVTEFPFHENAMRALDSKNDEVALAFLQHPKIDLAKEDQIYLRRACEHGLPQTVKFLTGQPKVNPAVQDSVTLRSAALNGHVEVVKILMEDGRVDPAAKANHAIQCAVLGDKIEIVAMLLADQRVNPSVNGNYAYTKAKSKEVKELLAKDERVRSKLPK